MKIGLIGHELIVHIWWRKTRIIQRSKVGFGPGFKLETCPWNSLIYHYTDLSHLYFSSL